MLTETCYHPITHRSYHRSIYSGVIILVFIIVTFTKLYFGIMISVYTYRWKSYNTMNCCPSFDQLIPFYPREKGIVSLIMFHCFCEQKVQAQICNPIPIKFTGICSYILGKWLFNLSWVLNTLIIIIIIMILVPRHSPAYSPQNSSTLPLHTHIPLTLGI